MDLINHIPYKQQFFFPNNLNLNNKIKNLNSEEKNVLQINKNFIEKHSWKWRIDNNFRFNLPPTIFELKKKIEIPEKFQHKSNATEYASKNIIGSKFTPEILKKIWENGQFEIDSNQEGLPYTWKLSNLTVKGMKNNILRYLKDMSISFNFIYTLKNRFDIKEYKNFSVSLFSCIYHLYITGEDFFDMLIGIPMYRNNDYELTRKIKVEEIKKFISLNPKFKYKMFDYKILHEKIFKIDDCFKNKWKKELFPEKQKLYKRQKLSKSQISLNLQNDEKIEFLKFLVNFPNFQKLKKEFSSIEEFLQSQQIIINEKFKVEEEYEQKMQNFEKELQKHSIKILCYQWKHEKENNYSNILRNEQKIKLNKSLSQKLESKKEPFIIYSFNTNNEEHFPEKIKKMKKEEKCPLSEYNATRLEIMPYEVKKQIIQNKNYYYVDKKKYYYVKTDFLGWRVYLFLIKLFTTFFNYNIRVYRQMTSSMIGIKALFLTELYRDQNVDSSNGILYPCYRTYTFPRSVKNLITWINDSRIKFENSPDTGILGKGISRIFNLILNYIIRLIILGGLLILFYPLFIISNIIICLGLILISPLMAFIWNFLDYLFSSLIYNRYSQSKLFCLLRIIIKDFLINTIYQFTIFCLCLIIQPVLSLIFFIYSHIHFILRYLYDFFFYYILKYLGKIPLTDSIIAWRISGPHLFRERFYDISNKDLINLVIAEIEKMVMSNYSKTMEKILNGPLDSINSIKELYNILNIDIRTKEEISGSIYFYQNLLRRQIKEQEKYPELSNNIKIKFTEERLDNVLNLVENYIRDYNKKSDLSFILNQFEDKKVEQLAEKILKNIFGYNIFETLDDVDKIVHLESMFDNNLDEISQRIFENPRYDDRIFVEKKIEKEKDIKVPKVAYFRDVFNSESPLFFDLNLLTSEEKKRLFNKID